MAKISARGDREYARYQIGPWTVVVTINGRVLAKPPEGRYGVIGKFKSAEEAKAALLRKYPEARRIWR
jgi:hypothetical protein